MITQIEIDGFKTFKDFKVELAPFQVIVGANGSGKSNLFDALHLLSRLAEVDLRTAFQEMRGKAHELFTVLPDGKRANRMRIAVEMLVDRKIQDSLGQEAKLTYTSLRYEIGITQQTDERGLEQLQVTHEFLKLIPQNEDIWSRKYGFSDQNGWLPEQSGRTQSFIGTYMAQHSPTPTLIEPLTICLYADGEGEERKFLTDKLQRTVLSLISYTNYPHTFAVRQEMLSWKFLNLDPKELRKPSSINATSFLTKDGGNLAAALARMQTEDSFAMTGVSLDIANLVPGILNIKVEKNEARGEYDIWADTDDGLFLTANVLSDGTLRLLALATLRNDAQFHGVLCLEEPENGVHPLHLKNMARLLREMVTNFNQPVAHQPLRQILVTTHSAAFMSQPAVIDSLLLTFMAKRVGEIHITRMEPVVMPQTQTQVEEASARERAMEVYTIDMVRQYLQQDTLNEAIDQLKKARLVTDTER